MTRHLGVGLLLLLVLLWVTVSLVATERIKDHQPTSHNRVGRDYPSPIILGLQQYPQATEEQRRRSNLIAQNLFKKNKRVMMSQKRAKKLPSKLEPIILVAGLGANRLDGKKKDVHNEPHWWCQKTTKSYYPIWMNIREMVPHATLGCFLHDFQPHYDIASQTISSTPGVTVKGHDFGGIEAVLNVEATFPSKSQYMGPLVEYFVKTAGYKTGVNLRAAPYDFRLGFKEHSAPGGYFSKLQALVEDTFAKNGNTRVHLVGHSLGGPLLNVFLSSYVPQEWKDKYIKSLIPIGPPFAGAPVTSSIMLEGYNYGLSVVKNEEMLTLMRRAGSIGAMMPQPNDKPILLTDVGNFTANDMPRLFSMIKDEHFASIIEREAKYDMKKAPGVAVNCIYSLKEPTPTMFTVHNLLSDKKRNVTAIVGFENGDGTVPEDSLRHCDKFAEKQDTTKYPVNVFHFYGMNHVAIIYNKSVWDRILSLTTTD